MKIATCLDDITYLKYDIGMAVEYDQNYFERDLFTATRSTRKIIDKEWCCRNRM